MHLLSPSCVPSTLLSAYTMPSSWHKRRTPYTFSSCPQLLLILLLPWKVPVWSIPLRNKERNKKRIVLSSSSSWNCLCSNDSICLFPGCSWLRLSWFIWWMPQWGRFTTEVEWTAGNLSYSPYWWWMAKVPGTRHLMLQLMHKLVVQWLGLHAFITTKGLSSIPS